MITPLPPSPPPHTPAPLSRTVAPSAPLWQNVDITVVRYTNSETRYHQRAAVWDPL